MAAITGKYILDNLNPTYLTGPIFNKELRVSSRRRSSYIIRFGYCLCLGLYVLSIWYLTVRTGSLSSVAMVSRLSEIGRKTATSIISFQFFIMQLIAVLIMSTSMGDEIRKGTLNVLMTTPISSFQIVMGKLFSGLLQLLILLATSLPLLAIIRVFGGIPWNQVIAGLSITLTAAVLAGSVSLFLSMVCRHGYTAVLTAIIGYLITFAVIPVIMDVLANQGIFNKNTIQSVIILTNPFVAQFSLLTQMSAANATVMNMQIWQLHCLIVLGFATAFITISIIFVRKITLRRAYKKSIKTSRSKSLKCKPVTCSPIIWRERRRGFLGSNRSERTLLFVLLGLALLIAIMILMTGGNINRNLFLILSVFHLAVMVRAAVLAAGSIVNEKESGTLSILLTTPLDDKRIVRDKMMAILYLTFPLLTVYSILYVGIIINYQRNLIPAFLLSAFIIIFRPLAVALFVIGSGLYFSSRLRTTTGAIAATVGLYLIMSYLIIGFGVKFLQIMMINSLSRGSKNLILQFFPFFITPLTGIIYIVSGIILSRRAVKRLRSNLF